MKLFLKFSKIFFILLLANTFILGVNSPVLANAAEGCTGVTVASAPPCSSVQTSSLGFQIPSLGDILTFAIRVFFIIAGLAALFYMLIGAFTWITSGGDEEATTGARNKIQAAVFGMILIVGVLAIIWTLEQVIFNRRICLGLSCTLTLPSLVKVTDKGAYCCTCLKSNGTRGNLINTRGFKCNADGEGVVN